MNLIDFLFVLQQFRIFIWPSQISSPQNTFQNRKERKTKENKTWEARRSFHTLCHYVVRVKSMIVKYLNFISQGFKISVFIITLANSPKTNKRTTRKNPIDSLGLKHTKHKPYTWNTSPAKKKKKLLLNGCCISIHKAYLLQAISDFQHSGRTVCKNFHPKATWAGSEFTCVDALFYWNLIVFSDVCWAKDRVHT